MTYRLVYRLPTNFGDEIALTLHANTPDEAKREGAQRLASWSLDCRLLSCRQVEVVS